MATSSEDVAKWMHKKAKQGSLYQDDAVWKIRKKFGEEFSYDNANGNLAIDKDVLKEFNKISKEDVVWSRGEKMWRARTPKDGKGRAQY